MRNIFTIVLSCICGLAVAKLEHITVINGNPTTCIYFPEPVVSHAVATAADEAPPQDRGVTLFRIEGDARYTPRADWADQNRLELKFPVGTSCNTTYRLIFNKDAHYLSGAAITPREVEFRCLPDSPRGVEITDARGAAVLVCSDKHTTREARKLSAGSGARFEFRRVKRTFWTGKRYYARRVAAVVEPARVGDGAMRSGVSLLETMGEKVWKNLKLGDPLPGHVLVRPAEKLPEDETWALVSVGGGVFPAGEEVCAFSPRYELHSGLESTSLTPGCKEVELQLYFSHPLRKQDVPLLFSRLGFCVEGQGSVSTSADGRNRRLSLPDGRWLNFRYVGPLECFPVGKKPRTPVADELAYIGGGLADGIRLCVSGHLANVVDITVPQGTTAANGAATHSPHVHRIALNPAWPELQPGSEECTVLPLHGEHKVRLRTTNLAEVDVTLRRVAHEHVVEAFFALPYDSRRYRCADYTYRVQKERESRDLSDGVVGVKEAKNAALRELAAARKDRLRRLEGAQSFPTRRYALKQLGLYNSSELVVELDALAGHRLKPGLYILTLNSRPEAPVQKALAQNGAEADTLNYEVDVPVLVTDINIVCTDKGVLATRFSDGDVLSSCMLTQQLWNADTKRWDVKKTQLSRGVAYMNAVGQNIIVQQGQDMAIACMWSPPLRVSEPTSPEKTELSCYLFADRPIYRPGDTVHLRGMLRRTKDNAVALPQDKMLIFSMLKPDGSKLSEQELTLSEYGNFSAELKLPEGEEDVTGDYTLTVRSGDFEQSLEVRCEVFRRDAFAATLAVDMEKIAPSKLSLHVQADDYSGVPLAGARVELKVGEDTHKLSTDTDGRAWLELPMKSEWLSRESLRVEGSVCNDREEYVVLPAQELSFSPADFIVRCEDARLYLADALTGAALSREQCVTVRLWAQETLPQNPRALFSRLHKKERTIATATLTVPANCRDGLPLPPQLCPDNPGGESRMYTISGRDAAGREETHSCRASMCRQAEAELQLELEPAEQAIKLRFVSPDKGMAHVFVGCGETFRHVQHPVQKGEQSLCIPLREREVGTVSISLVLVQRNRPGAECDTDFCFVSSPTHRLGVVLNVPEAPIRPGQKVQFSGQVLAEGKPASAEVTLYAVDSGMLSVRRYDSPEPEEYFYSGEAYTLCPVAPRKFEMGIWGERCIRAGRLSAVWNGEPLHGECWYMSGRQQLPFAKSNYGLTTSGLRSGSVSMEPASMDCLAVADEELPPWLIDGEEGGGAYSVAPVPVVTPCMDDISSTHAEIRLRHHFEPVAVWQASLRTDADGCFCTEAELPDTLTSYRVFAVAADRSGKRFGTQESNFVVNLPVMITPGIPLFMSLGDSLRLPLSITNATAESGTWTVSMRGCDTPQQVELPAGASCTLYFDVAPTQEGECTLTWQAVGTPGTDAVQGRCKVRFPAPVLKEVHHPVLEAGSEPLRLASLFAPEVAEAGRAQVQLLLSSNPLLHLSGALDFLLEYPYGCTEQRASALLPWLLYDELAPFCPQMAATPGERVQEVVAREINALFARQCEDGGLGYWEKGRYGCGWASSYAALAFTIAQERGFEVPKDKMKRLLDFVEDLNDRDLLMGAEIMAARALGDSRTLRKKLQKIEAEQRKHEQEPGYRPGVYGANVRFLLALQGKGDADAAFRTWLRTVGQNYRLASTHHSAMTLLALHDYLRKRSLSQAPATAVVQGRALALGKAPVEVPPPQVECPGVLTTAIEATSGTVYALVRAKAQPDTMDFSGVSEKGLQVTRVYETKGTDGIWRKAPPVLKVGDVVRVTLTCAKVADELEYIVLEDYLPACMEAINPEVPSQAAGLEPCTHSSWFDHREYLADRVRGFCSRWPGRDLLNMTYYARVKRAGSATAPPAQAQLMYEPQTYGLSPNTRVKAE